MMDDLSAVALHSPPILFPSLANNRPMAWVQSPVREGDQTGEDGILRCAGGGIVTTQHLSARSLDQLISPRETAPISLRHNRGG